MSKEQPKINIPELCKLHHKVLVRDAGYSESDSWRSLTIATQIALFQTVTSDKSIMKKLKGNIEKLPRIGCLACCKPDAFGKILEVAKTHDIGKIKELGEKWIQEASKKEK